MASHSVARSEKSPGILSKGTARRAPKANGPSIPAADTVDALLADDTFAVIEVNLDHPGSSPPLAQYLPALRRIQQAGRPLPLWGEIGPSDWDLLQEELSPIGLSIQPIIKFPEDIRRYRRRHDNRDRG